jgi:hypothetical protein
MDDDKSEKTEASQPAGTGLTEETKEGAFMVVGTVDKTRKLLGKLKERLKMPEVELMEPGPWAQRTWFAVVPSSPLLELAIAAAAAGKWVIASVDGCDVSWRFEVKGAPPPKRIQRQSPTKPSVMPSVAPQRAAGAAPARAWERPLSYTSQRVHPSPLSKEEVSLLIKTEVASLLTQYEQQLAAATAEVKRQEAEIKVKDADLKVKAAEIDSLKQALAAATSAVPAAAPSAPGLQCQSGKSDKHQESRWAVRDYRDLNKDVKGVAEKCTAVQEGQRRRDQEVAVLSVSLSALHKQMDTLQQLIMSDREGRQSQGATRSRKNGPVGAVVPSSPQVFNFGDEISQQPLPQAPVWPVHKGGFVFGQAASAGVAPAEPEVEKGIVVVRPPELASGEEGEGDEEEAEDAQETEAVLQVAPQLASPPAKPTRERSPGDTPSRDEVLRQNAADRMSGVEDDAVQWFTIMTPPEEARRLMAEEEARCRRGPLFEDQNQNLTL